MLLGAVQTNVAFCKANYGSVGHAGNEECKMFQLAKRLYLWYGTYSLFLEFLQNYALYCVSSALIYGWHVTFSHNPRNIL